MKKKNPLSAFLWLLLIPGQLIIGFLFISLGAILDQAIASASETGQGHPAPFISLIFGLIVGAVSIAVVGAAIILTVTHLIKIIKNNKNHNEL